MRALQEGKGRAEGKETTSGRDIEVEFIWIHFNNPPPLSPALSYVFTWEVVRARYDWRSRMANLRRVYVDEVAGDSGNDRLQGS